jgi:methylglutaconyl-CoA hydratase
MSASLFNHLLKWNKILIKHTARSPANIYIATQRSFTSIPSYLPSTAAAVASSKNYDNLLLHQHNNCLYITMNRASLHNAFNELVISDLTGAFTNEIQPSTRAVILASVGASFSAGADLNWMKKMKNYSREDNIKDSINLFNMVNSIYNCPVPVIARVQGSALGGGVGLISACDIAIGINNAENRYGLTEVKLGLAPAVISKFVVEKIGINNTKRYFLTGERFNSEVAAKIGLLNELAADEKDLDDKMNSLIKEISSNSPEAVKKSKQLVRNMNQFYTPLDSRNYVTQLIAELRVSAEGQEGVAAFLEKRKPNWIKKQ